MTDIDDRQATALAAQRETAAAIRAILRQHLEHEVTVNGWHERIVTATSISTDNVIAGYGGFVVHCDTCDTNLSRQWG